MISIDELNQFVVQQFPRFGRNKEHEIVRLLYEIVSRDRSDCRTVIAAAPAGAFKGPHQFSLLKEYLLGRRYPSLTKEERQKVLLMSLNVYPEEQVSRLAERRGPVAERIFVEKKAERSELFRRLTKAFPSAQVETIGLYSEYIQGKSPTISNYNDRLRNFFVVNNNHDMFCECPCSFPAQDCGYHIMNLGQGCAFECAYCFLQAYVNGQGIILPSNIDDYFSALPKYGEGLRLGSGQFSDSLVFEHLTNYVPKILDFFRKHPGYIFEFKTKSNNIKNLLKEDAPEDVVVSWSVNPQCIIDEAEWFTASLSERLEAAKKCGEAGYAVGFHFDPIVFYEGWESDYFCVVDRIFECAGSSRIAWISLGTLRMTPRLKQVMESRFPGISLLNGELVLGFDGKLRYPERIRRTVYSKIKQRIREYSTAVPVYLCMEDKSFADICDTATMKKFIHR